MTGGSDDPSVTVENADAFVRRLGRWPDFHDAEVVSLALFREGVILDLQIKVARTSGETDAAGYFMKEAVTLVTLRFFGIADLELGAFNQQNVISSLSVIPLRPRFEITLYPSFGLGGSFSCDRISVNAVEPLESW